MALAEIVTGITGVRFARSYRAIDNSATVETVVEDPFGTELKSFYTYFENKDKGLEYTNNLTLVCGVLGTGSIAVGLAEMSLGISGLSGAIPDMPAIESSKHIAIGLLSLRVGIELIYRSSEALSKFKALATD
jgi:hypothetical protein